MERLGYDTESDHYTVEITIEEKEGKTEWHIAQENSTKTFKSIYELARNLRMELEKIV
jgi:hypothetical protein